MVQDGDLARHHDAMAGGQDRRRDVRVDHVRPVALIEKTNLAAERGPEHAVVAVEDAELRDAAAVRLEPTRALGVLHLQPDHPDGGVAVEDRDRGIERSGHDLRVVAQPAGVGAVDVTPYAVVTARGADQLTLQHRRDPRIGVQVVDRAVGRPAVDDDELVRRAGAVLDGVDDALQQREAVVGRDQHDEMAVALVDGIAHQRAGALHSAASRSLFAASSTLRPSGR